MKELNSNTTPSTRKSCRPCPLRERLYPAIMAFWFLGILTGLCCWAYQIFMGLGVEGVNHPIAWGTYLVNFVFFVGLAHSGTLISAILFLFRARWRTAISRSAEAMTVFAVMVAGLFPFIHLGRVWVVYWILPYPNQRTLWPDFQSPLVFDVIAISTYLMVSLLFWYTGLIPDLAAVRDRSQGLRRKIYGLFSLNWTGSHREWRHHGGAVLLLAALATPLVISVHSVVSWDFALSILPGWHSTIFAPYFVAGAIHSGLAMVLILLIPMRRIYKFENIITLTTLENIAKTIVLTGLIMSYSYLTEHFMSWYSGNTIERDSFYWRMVGYYKEWFWLMIFCNSIAPLFYFIKKIRTNIKTLYLVAVLVVVGMWYERYVIIITSPAHAYDPYIWRLYQGPTWVEYGILFGAFSIFFFLFFLFSKFLPVISMAELKEEITLPENRKCRICQTGRSKPMTRQQALMGIFVDLDDLLVAIKALDGKAQDLTVYSPAAHGEIKEALRQKPSPVRYYTLFGGLFGLISGFSLAVYTVLQWKFVVSGKPIIPWIPFVIIGFEFLILFGVLISFAGMLIHSRLPRLAFTGPL